MDEQHEIKETQQRIYGSGDKSMDIFDTGSEAAMAAKG